MGLFNKLCDIFKAGDIDPETLRDTEIIEELKPDLSGFSVGDVCKCYWR